MKSILPLGFAWVLLVVPAAWSAEGKAMEQVSQEITLIVPDAPVFIPGDNKEGIAGLFRADLTQASAAERLQMLIGRAMGLQPRIVSASKTPESGLRIFVGYGSHLVGRTTPPSAPEGLKIEERDGDLFLLGEIAGAGTNNWPGAVDRGLMHAVETFAEEVMGFRFLISTPNDAEMFELGTVIPTLAKLTIKPGLRIEEAPVFQHRVASTWPVSLMGLRSGSAPAFNCNHSYAVNWWAKTYAKEHPEMFVPKEPDAAGPEAANAAAMGAARHLKFLDYTEPLVLEKRLEHLQTFFETGKNVGGFYREPTTAYIMEEPPDMASPSFQYNERSRALWNPSHGLWGDFANIWFDYLGRMSAEVKTRWPHMRISALAYNRHYGLPSFEIPDNIDVMLAVMRSSMQNKEPYVFGRNLAHVKQWSAHLGGDRRRMFLWEYGCWPTSFVTPPLICPDAMQEWLQAVEPYVSGVFFELSGPIEYNFLMRRIWMRLLWNPKLDVAAEIEDVCHRFYGPAGDSMTAFYRRLIDRYEMKWKQPRLIWEQYYVAPELYYGQSYPPEEITRLAALLEQACRQVGLPQVVEADLQSGSAVHLFNAATNEVPVSITLTAGEQELIDPAVGWDYGRLSWRGRLQPGERLDIAASGQTTLMAEDGSAREVDVVREGGALALGAGKADVFHFWHAALKGDVGFHVALHYGADAGMDMDRSKNDIYARRLAWVRDPFLVFHATGTLENEKRGFFVDAHVAHQHLGHVPSYGVFSADAWPVGIDDPVWQEALVADLVMGRKDGTTPYQIMGYPADLRTKVQFVQARDGLAVRFDAEGAPMDGEKIVLLLNATNVTFTIGAKSEGRSVLRELQVDRDGWRAMAAVDWRALGLAADKTPPALSVQIMRERGEARYLWSPPLGMWGQHEQGPGKLHLVRSSTR